MPILDTTDRQQSTPPESTGTESTDTLPDYADQLAAFHRAFTPELRDVIRSLPLRNGMRILDLGCGDGFYLGLFAEELASSGSPAPSGKIIGLDVNTALLNLAQQNPSVRSARCQIDLVPGSLADLSSTGPKFDLVWCAQSLYSFPEPVAALQQMAQAVTPTGLVVVLENDSLHQLLLPWPPHLEIALRAAELQAFSQESRQPGKFYVGRYLPALFAAAGLRPLGFKTQCIDRRAPLDADLRQFLASYLTSLAERTRPRLDRSHIQQFEALIDADSSDYLLCQPHFTMSWVNVLAWGEKPA